MGERCKSSLRIVSATISTTHVWTRVEKEPPRWLNRAINRVVKARPLRPGSNDPSRPRLIACPGARRPSSRQTAAYALGAELVGHDTEMTAGQI
jgi:hypothetical protein